MSGIVGSYLPCLGSAAHIMFLASHICWVSSGMVRELYCWEPLEVKGAKPTMKKWRRGKGIRLTASLRRSELSWPGNRRQHVTPLIVVEIKWFRSPTASCHQQHKKYQSMQEILGKWLRSGRSNRCDTYDLMWDKDREN